MSNLLSDQRTHCVGLIVCLLLNGLMKRFAAALQLWCLRPQYYAQNTGSHK